IANSTGRVTADDRLDGASAKGLRLVDLGEEGGRSARSTLRPPICALLVSVVKFGLKPSGSRESLSLAHSELSRVGTLSAEAPACRALSPLRSYRFVVAGDVCPARSDASDRSTPRSSSAEM